MTGVYLLLASCAAFMNGCALFGKIDARAVWPINLIAGIFSVFTVAQILMTSSLGASSAFVAIILTMSGADFILGVVDSLLPVDPRAHGYFLHFAAAIYALAAVHFLELGSMTFAFCSLAWSAVSVVMAGVIVYQRCWIRAGGFMVFFVAYVTLFLPGYLTVMGTRLP